MAKAAAKKKAAAKAASPENDIIAERIRVTIMVQREDADRVRTDILDAVADVPLPSDATLWTR